LRPFSPQAVVRPNSQACIGIVSIGNFLSPFSLYGNAGLPVDLQNDGPTPNDGHNDTGTGANNLLEYPVITAAAGGVALISRQPSPMGAGIGTQRGR
jgi:hypothetical protein